MKAKYRAISIVLAAVSVSLWGAVSWVSKDWNTAPSVVEKPEVIAVPATPLAESPEKVPTIGKIAAPIFQPLEERDDAMLFEVDALSFLPFESF